MHVNDIAQDPQDDSINKNAVREAVLEDLRKYYSEFERGDISPEKFSDSLDKLTALPCSDEYINYAICHLSAIAKLTALYGKLDYDEVVQRPEFMVVLKNAKEGHWLSRIAVIRYITYHANLHADDLSRLKPYLKDISTWINTILIMPDDVSLGCGLSFLGVSVHNVDIRKVVLANVYENVRSIQEELGIVLPDKEWVQGGMNATLTDRALVLNRFSVDMSKSSLKKLQFKLAQYVSHILLCGADPRDLNPISNTQLRNVESITDDGSLFIHFDDDGDVYLRSEVPGATFSHILLFGCDLRFESLMAGRCEALYSLNKRIAKAINDTDRSQEVRALAFAMYAREK